MGGRQWWPVRTAERLLLAGEVALLPLRAAALALEVALLGTLAAGCCLAAAVYAGALPAAQARGALEAAGKAALGVLRAQGVY